MSSILYLDTEYSSFFSNERGKSGDLLEVGFLTVIDGEIKDEFSEYCRPLGKVWNTHAEKVHKIKQSFALVQQHPQQLADKIAKILEDHGTIFTLCGHNVKGDINYLERLMRDWGHELIWFRHIRTDKRDTHDRAKERKQFLPIKNLKLTTLCTYFKIPIDAHRAFGDAKATMLLDQALNGIELPSKSKEAVQMMNLTEVEKRRKYLDIKYVQMNGEGSVFITEYCTQNKEALRIVLEELWRVYVD